MVENAIIDFISLKEIALINDHIKENRIKRIKHNNINSKLSITKIKVELNINPKYTPAITIVELCKRAEIGVGADIAFNNQENKGN